MKIHVKAKPGAKKTEIKKISETEFAASVKESAQKGKANKALIKALAAYFGLNKSAFNIRAGKTSRRKIIEIKKL
jgi:uncharacterized protein (TIGR00251 family)